jgi:predicted metal-dependent hydrolase
LIKNGKHERTDIQNKSQLPIDYKTLSVAWHCVDKLTIECEATVTMPDRFVFHEKESVELIVQYHDGILDLIYHDATNFESNKIQKWLRELMQDTILSVARIVLPARVKYWEDLKGLRGTGVTVKRLRKNVLGHCSHSNHITLQPFLVIFKQDWADGVILHEMAHYKYKHHRKSFWNFLSTLIGKDSQLAKVKHDIAMSPYYNYYLYLTKN